MAAALGWGALAASSLVVGALLALYRRSGDEYWLKEARSLTLRALGPRLTGSPLALSLYKGALGTAVLAAELPTPATASMPLFEAERW